MKWFVFCSFLSLYSCYSDIDVKLTTNDVSVTNKNNKDLSWSFQNTFLQSRKSTTTSPRIILSNHNLILIL